LIEQPHPLQIIHAESSAKTLHQIFGQPLDQLFAILSPALATLLKLDNPPADLPIGGGHDGIDRPRRISPEIHHP
jgi:hypothetical protein